MRLTLDQRSFVRFKVGLPFSISLVAQRLVHLPLEQSICVRFAARLPFSIMKLIDIAVNKNFKNQTLKDGNFYIVLEQKDVLGPLFNRRRFTAAEFNEYASEYQKFFKEFTDSIVAKLTEKLGEEHVKPEEDIVCYVNDNARMSMCLRCFILDVEDGAALNSSIDELKSELLKNDIYLRVKS